MDPEERAALMSRARLKAQDRAVPTDLPADGAGARHRLGQGRRRQVVGEREPRRRARPPGLVVGLLDADIWGYSVPRLLGMDGAARGARRAR